MEMLGKYQIYDQIGHGAFATVYRAVDTRLDRPVALKVLAPNLAADPEFAQRFAREAKAAAQLDHPNIVTIYDFDSIEGTYFIAMELVDGQSLDQLLSANQAMPLPRTADIIQDIASALDHAHAKRMVHRDIKPSNIIIASDGRAVVTDFGLVKVLEGPQLTATIYGLGTPEYMSPEQAELDPDRPIDARSDIYSLGVVLYQMVTGQVPFSGKSPTAVLHKHVYEPPPPPRSLAPSVPEEVERVILRALAKRPEERYATAGELAFALRAAIETKSIEIRPPNADFAAEPLSGPAPLTVNFHNTSTGEYSGCVWEYGDGRTGISRERQHRHTYFHVGTYSVRLTVTGRGGSSTKVQREYVTVQPPTPLPDNELRKRVDSAARLELLGWIGLLGLGWISMGKRAIGLTLLVAWLLMVPVGAGILALTTGGLACLVLPIVAIAGPLISAAQLRKYFDR